MNTSPWFSSFYVAVEAPTTSTTKTAACAEFEDEDVVERASVTVSESSELTTESVTDTDTTTTNTSPGESRTQELSELQVNYHDSVKNINFKLQTPPSSFPLSS